jgi:hypothetical protein
VPMPRPLFHATMPGPVAGSGPIAMILRVLMLGVALAVAFFFIVVAFVVGGFFLLLRALGLGGKSQRPSPFAPFGTPFAGQNAGAGQEPGNPFASQQEEPKDSHSQKETVKELEEFHGSLDEYLQQRKGQNPS